MCGLTGIFDVHARRDASDLEREVRFMADTLVHRGPDDAGTWLDARAGIALGFRRLAIVDLSPHGHQPMVSDDGRFVLAFNGEIYNFEDLRERLTGLGDRPYRGRSDTEVMLRAFEAWGVDEALTRFVGMFAFALGRSSRTLHLARDRFGEKPLYYGWDRGRLVFGSELKAIEASGLEGAVDLDALRLFLRYGYVPAPYSIYRGISKLPPGTWLTLSADQPVARPEPRPYWSAKQAAEAGLAEPFDGEDEEAVDELERLLRGIIRRQMIADVPLGAFLSGGTDSSTVVAIMQAISSRPVRTFTIGFEEAEFNEAVYAKQVARHLGTDHTELYVTPAAALDVIPKLPTIFDEPYADPSQIPTFLVAEMASRHVTVSLSGDGGDEFFAGYAWYGRCSRLWKQMSRFPRAVRGAAAGGLAAVSPGGWDWILGGVRAALPRRARPFASGDRLHKLAEIVSRADSVESVYDGMVSRWNGDCPMMADADGRTSGDGRAAVDWHGSASSIERLMYRDATMYLPDDILAKVDRTSMAVSLEVRAPLLDHRVYEFAWSLPLAIKTRDGRGKWPLRRLLERFVPRAIVDRPKKGFGVPIDSWLRGPLRQWAADLLDEATIRRQGFFNPQPILQKWREHLSGSRNWHNHLWNVLMFQAWLAGRSTPSQGTRDAHPGRHELVSQPV